MRKKAFLLAVLILVSMQATSLAAISPPTGVAATEPGLGTTAGTQARVQIESLQYINVAKTTIQNNYDSSVSVTGTTGTKGEVDEIGVTIYLQKWDGSNWVNVGTPRTGVGRDTSLVDKIDTIPVTPDAYYRTRAYHWAIQQGTTEDAFTTSQYIYVE